MKRRLDRQLLVLIAGMSFFGCSGKGLSAPAALPAPAASHTAPALDGRCSPRPEVRSLYDWALSRCLGGAAKDAGDRDDAYKTAGAYLERSEVKFEVYEKMQALIDAVSARTYGGSVPGEYRTMKCIDLYESEELQRLIGGATK